MLNGTDPNSFRLTHYSDYTQCVLHIEYINLGLLSYSSAKVTMF